MNEFVTSVREFHETFEHPIGQGVDCIEPLKIRQLRAKLLFEELSELVEAGDIKATFADLCLSWLNANNAMPKEYEVEPEVFTVHSHRLRDGDNVNKLEELDALCDIQYVLAGKILTSGLHEVFDRSFQLVHQNNMNKAHRNMEHAKETIEKSLGGKGTISVRDGKFIVLNEYKKVIKPHDHVKVKLSL